MGLLSRFAPTIDCALRAAELLALLAGRNVKGFAFRMYAQPMHDNNFVPRPSRVIAEALVGRHGPTQIAAQAAALGLSRQLTQVIVCACTSTAIDNTQQPKRNATAAP